MTYDILILGGGPAGFRAAERAGHFGLNVAIFEGKALGGVCLNEGCIPTKTMLYSAKLYDYAKGGAAKYGVTTRGAALDHEFVMARKDKVVKKLVAGVEMQMKKARANVIRAVISLPPFAAATFSPHHSRLVRRARTCACPCLHCRNGGLHHRHPRKLRSSQDGS